MTAGPTQREPHPVDVFLVASAAEASWPADVDLDLIGALCEVEEAVREQNWAALERLLGHVEDDALTIPGDPAERDRLAGDFEALGWHHPAPAEGCHDLAPLDPFEAIEIFARWARPDGGLDLPSDLDELDRLAAALALLEWWRPGPEGWTP